MHLKLFNQNNFKLQMIPIILLFVLTHNTFATRSRVESLGQFSERGSDYISDSRNIFKNAAHVGSFGNYLVTEWGTPNVLDSSTDPRAEGGFFRLSGPFAYGVYLGDNGDETKSNFQNQNNGVDLFLGGDMGTKWGMRAHISSSSNQTGAFEKKNQALGVGLGIIQGDLESFININLSDKSKGASTVNDQWNNKLGIHAGASLKIQNWVLFSSFENSKTEVTRSGVAMTDVSLDMASEGYVNYDFGTSSMISRKFYEINVGGGHTHEVSPTARVFTDVRLQTTSRKVSGVSSLDTDVKTVSTYVMPVNVSFETDATSWMTLRGSVGQNILINRVKIDGKKNNTRSSTYVAAGATLLFQKLSIDGLIGTSSASRSGSIGTNTNDGVLSTDNLLTRVGLTYNF